MKSNCYYQGYWTSTHPFGIFTENAQLFINSPFTAEYKTTRKPYSNKKAMGRYYWTVIVAVFILGCSKDGSQTAVIDADLLPYFEKFGIEANARGIHFSVESANISGEMIFNTFIQKEFRESFFPTIVLGD